MFKNLVIGLLIIALASCGGSDSTSSNSISNISGLAQSPGGTVAQIEQNKPLILAIADFILQPSWAAVTGLTPIPNATVELIRIDDSGNQLGDIVAETETDNIGEYTLDLPSGVQPAGDLVVQIRGSATSLRAIVTSETVNINPISQFILDTLISEPDIILAGLNVATVQDLVDEIEAIEIDLSGSVTLEDAISSIASNSEVTQAYDDGSGAINDSGIIKRIPIASIQLDGMDDDWTEISTVHDDPVGDQHNGGTSAVDISIIKVATDNTSLFFLLKTAGNMVFPHTPSKDFSKYDIFLEPFTNENCTKEYTANNTDFIIFHGWGENHGDSERYPGDGSRLPLTIANMGNVQEFSFDLSLFPESIQAIQIEGKIEAFTNGESHINYDTTPYSVCYILP